MFTVSNPHRIVAEVSKSWTGCTKQDGHTLISRRFEAVIEENIKRGYQLESWNLSQVWMPEARQMVETIVAVFVRTL